MCYGCLSMKMVQKKATMKDEKLAVAGIEARTVD